ncbi:hypothetical protein L873DRAFT_1791840 [Choiromyces venosus 120613-1]|uniref:RNI-like protein n=1 Tax=Choiromyces venosus 120613-1 TaxID=1336337 RepID=A0A3N4JCS7_9PEZI|nr:hypothetical protein L873DRAFT_1791840 [Choiromyces venosus 120613-1]
MEPTQVLPLVNLSNADLVTAAAGIQCLDLASQECKHHALFRNIPLPKLESVTIDASEDNSSGRLLEPYLQPKLRVFEFFGGVLDDQFLRDLAVSFCDTNFMREELTTGQEKCPLLEEVLIDNPREVVTPGGFLRFLEGAKKLKRVVLMYGMERLITREVFCELSSRSCLEILGIGGVVSEDFVVAARVRTNGQDLFPGLLGLTCTGSAAGTLLLSKDLKNLARAEIILVGSAVNFLGRFSQACPELEYLCVTYTCTPTHIEIPPREILVIPRSLPKLTHLFLTGKITSPSLQDEHIIAFAKDFAQNVKVLRLGFRETRLTEKSLIHLGQRLGSTLVECELVGRFEIDGLGGGAVLFPVLKELALREAVEWKERGQELVTGWAPEVEDVQFWTGFGEFE